MRGGPGSPRLVGAGGEAPVITLGEDERELLRAVFDASAVGLALVAGDQLRYVKVNPAYRALTLAPEVDPVGRTFAEVWSVPAACLRELERAASTGGVAHVEDCPVPFGGGTRWFSYHARPLRYGGQVALLLEVSETTAFVQARQSAEAGLDHALRRAAELDAVIDAIADGFVLYGSNGRVLRYNLQAARMVAGSGLDPQEAFAVPLPIEVTFTTAEGRALALEDHPVVRALAGETVVGAHLHVGAAGEDHWILVSAAPFRGSDGRVAGAVATFSDETAIHVLEDARDDLVRMISHDLRTPLNAVYTQAHLLRRSPHDPAKVTDRARSIVRSCERMSAMIHDLVDTTLLEAGQLHLAPVPVELQALVPELIERLRGGLDVDRVAVAVAPDLPQVSADPPRLERIMTNLLSNALKYSPVQAPVTLEIAPHPGGVRIAVSDRGVGIAPEDQAHLFERYFRARGTRRPEGLGLGLYITRLLVEAHQGRIEVESALGRGSTFRVFLPAVVAE